jgi:hypothetical protein
MINKKSKTNNTGTPQINHWAGAATSSRPQCGQITNCDEARLPQLRQRIGRGRARKFSPHSGQIEA